MKNPLGARASFAGLCAAAAVASGVAFVVPGAFAEPDAAQSVKTVEIGGVTVTCGPNGPTFPGGLIAAAGGGLDEICSDSGAGDAGASAGGAAAPAAPAASVPTESPSTIPPLPVPGDYKVTLTISGPKGEAVDPKNLKVGQKVKLSAVVTRDVPTVPTIPVPTLTPTTTPAPAEQPAPPATGESESPSDNQTPSAPSSQACTSSLVDPEGNCVELQEESTESGSSTEGGASAGGAAAPAAPAASVPTESPSTIPPLPVTSGAELPSALGGAGGLFGLSALKAAISGGTVSFFIGSDNVATVALDDGRASTIVTIKKEGTFSVSAVYTDPDGLKGKAEQSVTVVPGTGRLAYTGLDLGWGIMGLGTLAVAVGAGAYVFARRRSTSSDGDQIAL